ncbi:probable LRR receptor-like serine/threonine-protein kinase RFK1 isoform X2 [Durio zibethinus]|nr:probable LRR receptor-like serine/threonine-protein kinase RFK1 isoform X2 [Durio zibethinus]
MGQIQVFLWSETLQAWVLRNCNIFREIPKYIWAMKNLEMFDLSYNDFTWQGPEKPGCQENMNLNLNLFCSSSSRNNLRGALPCKKDFTCPQCTKNTS